MSRASGVGVRLYGRAADAAAKRDATAIAAACVCTECHGYADAFGIHDHKRNRRDYCVGGGYSGASASGSESVRNYYERVLHDSRGDMRG